MGNEKLSQEEINALLEAANSVSEPKDVKENERTLTDFENDAIGELGNISMGSAATAISTLLGKKVEITTPSVKERNISEVRKEFKGEKIVIRVDYIKTLNGTNAFVIEPYVGAVIADIMMGGTGENVNEEEELDDIKLSALGEAMNQMMGSAATALSEVVKGPVDITPPKIEKVNFDDEKVQFPPVYDGDEVVEVRFKIKIDGIFSGDMMQLMSPTFAKNFAGYLTNSFKPEEEKKEVSHVSQQSTSSSKASPQQSVKKVEFQEFEKPDSTSVPSHKLDTLLDIPLEISVELGHTTMTLKQVLDSGVGTLIELEKLTGEPVDILVNGKPVAEGEVMVIGENFGVRITRILSKKERLYTLK